MDRRTFGALAAASVAAGGASRAGADPLAGAALYADVKTYSGFGVHRTGTAGDEATGRWMLRELKRAGYRAERQDFDYPVFELARSDLSLDGRRIEGQPLWTPRTTPAGGVTAALSASARQGAIAVISLPYNPGASLELPGYRDPIAKAAASGAAAVVAITEGPVGELIQLNAEPNAAPWPVPVLLVAGRDGPALLEAARSGRRATLRLEGRTVTRTAYNVIGRRERPGKPLVVSTPRSGWLVCAGERGSGVAIWLGLARWLIRSTDHNLLVVANSGHEFHGYGGHLLAEHVAPKPADTKAWLHIGANVAAYDFALVDGKLTRLPEPQARRGAACTAELLPAARAAFAGQKGYDPPTNIDVQRAPGEVALYHRLGYRPIIGVVGGHPLHHTPRDLPDATGPQVLEPVARGLQKVLSTV